MAKKLILGPFGPNLDHQLFFVGFISTRCYRLLYAILQKNYGPTQENDNKPYFGPDLDSLGPNLSQQAFFFQKSGFKNHKIS